MKRMNLSKIFDNDELIKEYNRKHPIQDSFLKDFLIALNNFRPLRLYNRHTDGCREANPK